jgi:hypothetical protein
MMTPEERRELAQLYAADDRLRAEHADWLARREAAAASPVQKSDPEGILYRTTEQNGPADSQPSGVLFGDWRDQALSEAMGFCLVETRREMRKERDAALAERDRKIERLEAKLDAVLTIIGGDKAKSVAQVVHDDSVVHLPRFLRRTHGNAA